MMNKVKNRLGGFIRIGRKFIGDRVDLNVDRGVSIFSLSSRGYAVGDRKNLIADAKM